MSKSPSEEFAADGPVTWDDVAAFLAQLKETARALLAREGHAGTVHTTQLLNSALKKLNPQHQDWREVSWENREAFFKDAFFAMRRVLIDYARRRAVRRAVKVGGFETEHLAPLAQAGVLNLDCLVDRAAERADRAEAIDRALAELDALYPGKRLAEIVQHREFGGLTYREIARMLDIKDPETVSARWDLASALLRIELAEFAPREQEIGKEARP